MDRDFYLTPQAAVEFGLVDKVQDPRGKGSPEGEEGEDQESS